MNEAFLSQAAHANLRDYARNGGAHSTVVGSNGANQDEQTQHGEGWVAESLGLDASAETSKDSRSTTTRHVPLSVGALSGGQTSKQAQADHRVEMPMRLKELLAKTQQPKVLWSGKNASLVLMNNKVYRLGPMLDAVQM